MKIKYFYLQLGPPKTYKFGYAIKDKHGAQFREEAGDGLHDVKGSYGFVDERGIQRRVNYVADKEGFRAEVKTNEPGTAPENPASVKMESSAKTLEEAGSEAVKKESPTAELEKYFKRIAEIHNLEKNFVKESIFGKGMQAAEKESAIGKELEKLGADSEAKLALENLFKERNSFESYLKKAVIPYLIKEAMQKEHLGFDKQAGLGYLFPNQFTMNPFATKEIVGVSKEGLLFDAASVAKKLSELGLAYSPLMAGLGSQIPLKTAMSMKGLGKEQSLKGIALAPAGSKNNLGFIPIYGF